MQFRAENSLHLRELGNSESTCNNLSRSLRGYLVSRQPTPVRLGLSFAKRVSVHIRLTFRENMIDPPYSVLATYAGENLLSAVSALLTQRRRQDNVSWRSVRAIRFEKAGSEPDVQPAGGGSSRIPAA